MDQIALEETTICISNVPKNIGIGFLETAVEKAVGRNCAIASFSWLGGGGNRSAKVALTQKQCTYKNLFETCNSCITVKFFPRLEKSFN